ncbi:Zinc finger protein squeeze [Frankliniella fusca]|uniref:Zinc finger protein squeeze n=1 Tax=Frankliniella fusca TaxID=407009 RepID=A0AAE1HTK4_9NEOP|nr:Zinc finger protein squeeze [Frankliniella fusca]
MASRAARRWIGQRLLQRSVTMDLDINDNDISILSLNDSLIGITSTPHAIRTKKNIAATTKPANLFKVPEASKKLTQKQKALPKPKRKEKLKLVCNICGKIYVSTGYYKNHTRNHAIQGTYHMVLFSRVAVNINVYLYSAERYPDKTKIIESINVIVYSTLDAIVLSAPGGGVIELAQEIKGSVGICNHFESFCLRVCEIFCEGIITKKFLLPSKLLESLVKQCEVLTSDLSERSQLTELLVLSRSEHVSREVLNSFYCEFVLCFSEVLLRFIAQSVHEGPTTSKSPHEFDTEDRQIIHYIAGATLREFYKRAKRYPTSCVWKAVKDTIVYRFAASCDVESSSAADQSWTKTKDRGALIYVGDSCLEFFVLLAEIIENCEEPTGSISYMKVYEKVCNSMAATIYWDGMISDSLTEDVSLLFLRALVKSFCGTYGKGIRTRRINKIRERPEASVNLRHSLTRRAK